MAANKQKTGSCEHQFQARCTQASGPSPYTHHPLLPCPQCQEDSIFLSLSGLDTLARQQGCQHGSNYFVTFFKARALDRNTFLFYLIFVSLLSKFSWESSESCPFTSVSWRLSGTLPLKSNVTDFLETINSKETGDKPVLLKDETRTWVLFCPSQASPPHMPTSGQSYSQWQPYSGTRRPKKPISPSLISRNLFFCLLPFLSNFLVANLCTWKNSSTSRPTRLSFICISI